MTDRLALPLRYLFLCGGLCLSPYPFAGCISHLLAATSLVISCCTSYTCLALIRCPAKYLHARVPLDVAPWVPGRGGCQTDEQIRDENRSLKDDIESLKDRVASLVRENKVENATFKFLRCR